MVIELRNVMRSQVDLVKVTNYLQSYIRPCLRQEQRAHRWQDSGDVAFDDMYFCKLESLRPSHSTSIYLPKEYNTSSSHAPP